MTEIAIGFLIIGIVVGYILTVIGYCHFGTTDLDAYMKGFKVGLTAGRSSAISNQQPPEGTSTDKD